MTYSSQNEITLSVNQSFFNVWISSRITTPVRPIFKWYKPLYCAHLTSNIMICVESSLLINCLKRNQYRGNTYNSDMPRQDAAINQTTHRSASSHEEITRSTQFTYSIRPPPHHPFLKFAEATFTHLLGPENSGCVLVVSLCIGRAVQ